MCIGNDIYDYWFIKVVEDHFRKLTQTGDKYPLMKNFILAKKFSILKTVGSRVGSETFVGIIGKCI